MPHTLEAAEAVKNPPSCISGFGFSALPPGRINLAVEFSLTCKGCSGSAFQILAFPLLVTDPSPYYGLVPGDTFQRPPHRLRCTSCKTETPIFDGRTQGYDGVLNGGFAYESGESGEAAIPGEFTVIAMFFYNIEMAELLELAAEANVRPADLFDAFSIVATPLRGDTGLTLDYECT